MAALRAVRIQVAEETGPDFLPALRERLAGTPVDVGPIVDGTPADALVVGGWDVEADIRRAQEARARWVQTLTSGVDRVLGAGVDTSAVVLTNASGATARPVSEFAMARVFEHAKELQAIAEDQRRREWNTRWLGALAGATMTVVGLGPIGTRVARMARTLEMSVIGVRRDPRRDHEECHEVVGSADLGAALSRSDYCVLAPALTPETLRIVSADVLAQARPGLFLVNVGRGELVDHDALLAAARDGRLTAALDVFDEEPLPPDSPLWDVEGIAISSHTATLTPPLIGWLADLVAENARRFAEGLALLHVVDPSLGYPAAPTATSRSLRGPGVKVMGIE